MKIITKLPDPIGTTTPDSFQMSWAISKLTLALPRHTSYRRYTQDTGMSLKNSSKTFLTYDDACSISTLYVNPFEGN